jgi:glycosyltransferase involved in cell wall biosynthesis
VALKKKYRVGVFLPVYNQEFCIEKVINSILKQTYKNIIIYIGDDCSTDNTFEVVSEFSRKFENIICYKNKKNLGVIKNCNKLLDVIEKKNEIDLLCFTAGDDIMMQNKILKQVEIYDYTGINYICHNYSVVDLISDQNLGSRIHKHYGSCNLDKTISNGLPTVTCLLNFKKIYGLRYSNSESGTDLNFHFNYILNTGKMTYYIDDILLNYGRTLNNLNASTFDSNTMSSKKLILQRDNLYSYILILSNVFSIYIFYRFLRSILSYLLNWTLFSMKNILNSKT